MVAKKLTLTFQAGCSSDLCSETDLRMTNGDLATHLSSHRHCAWRAEPLEGHQICACTHVDRRAGLVGLDGGVGDRGFTASSSIPGNGNLNPRPDPHTLGVDPLDLATVSDRDAHVSLRFPGGARSLADALGARGLSLAELRSGCISSKLSDNKRLLSSQRSFSPRNRKMMAGRAGTVVLDGTNRSRLGSRPDLVYGRTRGTCPSNGQDQAGVSIPHLIALLRRRPYLRSSGCSLPASSRWRPWCLLSPHVRRRPRLLAKRFSWETSSVPIRTDRRQAADRLHLHRSG